VHGHRVLGRAAISEVFEEGRCACRPAGRVDDEIGVQHAFARAVVGHHPRAGDAVARRRRRQVDDIVRRQELDVSDLAHLRRTRLSSNGLLGK
jgi:hypothetical protein